MPNHKIVFNVDGSVVVETDINNVKFNVTKSDTEICVMIVSDQEKETNYPRLAQISMIWQPEYISDAFYGKALPKNKIPVIKMFREFAKVTLSEAKRLVELSENNTITFKAMIQSHNDWENFQSFMKQENCTVSICK